MQDATVQNSVARIFCTTDVEINIKQDKAMYVTLRRVRTNIVAVEKQEVFLRH
jgi:hypothetical protein